MDDALKLAGIDEGRPIDAFFLDVQGAELDVLQTLDMHRRIMRLQVRLLGISWNPTMPLALSEPQTDNRKQTREPTGHLQVESMDEAKRIAIGDHAAKRGMLFRKRVGDDSVYDDSGAR